MPSLCLLLKFSQFVLVSTVLFLHLFIFLSVCLSLYLPAFARRINAFTMSSLISSAGRRHKNDDDDDNNLFRSSFRTEDDDFEFAGACCGGLDGETRRCSDDVASWLYAYNTSSQTHSYTAAKPSFRQTQPTRRT